MLEILLWGKSALIVLKPFAQTAFIWLCWQTGIGFLAWSSARFYGINCAPPGINGYISSLFSMGSPICISTWISHTGMVVPYEFSFVAASMLSVLWIWKKTATISPVIKKLQDEIKDLKNIKNI